MQPPSRLRQLSAATVLKELAPDAEGHRCPSCAGRLELHDDPRHGVSLRCRWPRCRLARLGWLWPEHFAAELWRTDSIAEASQRLLQVVREEEEARRRPGRSGARARLAAFLAGQP